MENNDKVKAAIDDMEEIFQRVGQATISKRKGRKPGLRRYNETQRLIEKQRDANRVYRTCMAEGARQEERQQKWEELHQAKGEARVAQGD